MMSFGFGPPPRPRRGSGQTGQPQTRAQQLLPNTSDWYGRFRQVSNARRQDHAVTNSMGAIYDGGGC
jgi:hypothetical protein